MKRLLTFFMITSCWLAHVLSMGVLRVKGYLIEDAVQSLRIQGVCSQLVVFEGNCGVLDPSAKCQNHCRKQNKTHRYFAVQTHEASTIYNAIVNCVCLSDELVSAVKVENNQDNLRNCHDPSSTPECGKTTQFSRSTFAVYIIPKIASVENKLFVEAMKGYQNFLSMKRNEEITIENEEFYLDAIKKYMPKVEANYVPEDFIGTALGNTINIVHENWDHPFVVMKPSFYNPENVFSSPVGSSSGSNYYIENEKALMSLLGDMYSVENSQEGFSWTLSKVVGGESNRKRLFKYGYSFLLSKAYAFSINPFRVADGGYLVDSFLEDIDSLPRDPVNENENAYISYSKFLDKYGTHWVTGSDFGLLSQIFAADARMENTYSTQLRDNAIEARKALSTEDESFNYKNAHDKTMVTYSLTGIFEGGDPFYRDFLTKAFHNHEKAVDAEEAWMDSISFVEPVPRVYLPYLERDISFLAMLAIENNSTIGNKSIIIDNLKSTISRYVIEQTLRKYCTPVSSWNELSKSCDPHPLIQRENIPHTLSFSVDDSITKVHSQLSLIKRTKSVKLCNNLLYGIYMRNVKRQLQKECNEDGNSVHGLIDYNGYTYKLTDENASEFSIEPWNFSSNKYGNFTNLDIDQVYCLIMNKTDYRINLMPLSQLQTDKCNFVTPIPFPNHNPKNELVGNFLLKLKDHNLFVTYDEEGVLIAAPFPDDLNEAEKFKIIFRETRNNIIGFPSIGSFRDDPNPGGWSKCYQKSTDVCSKCYSGERCLVRTESANLYEPVPLDLGDCFAGYKRALCQYYPDSPSYNES